VAPLKSFILKIFLAGTLTGCATVTPPPFDAEFVLAGKLGVSVEGEGGSVRFRWQQAGARYQIDLWGALGQGRTRLEGDADRMKLLDGAGGELLQGAPEAVMQERLGWSLPVGVLPAWLWGQPASGAPAGHIERDAAGRIARFEQIGWQIAYDGFRLEASGELPRRVTLTRPGFRARIAIDERQGAPVAGLARTAFGPR
jgi:outer membrane lipoprotein LolB